MVANTKINIIKDIAYQLAIYKELVYELYDCIFVYDFTDDYEYFTWGSTLTEGCDDIELVAIIEQTTYEMLSYMFYQMYNKNYYTNRETHLLSLHEFNAFEDCRYELAMLLIKLQHYEAFLDEVEE